jgi:hypothetical protein
VRQVLGFQSAPRVHRYVERVYWDEIAERSQTRVWFGPRPEGFTVTPGGEEVNFTHIATRVYSAGSNPLRPGMEEKPEEVSRRTLGWWDLHYGDIADFESMYHVQNQIMKWSLVTAFLESNKLAPFLSSNSVKVDHSQRFDRWLRDTPELRFRHPVPFVPEPRWPNGREAIEILVSYAFPAEGTFKYISGGVSAGSKQDLSKATISRSIPDLRRRAGFDYKAHPDSLVMSDNAVASGVTYRLPDGGPAGQARIEIEPSKNSRFRSGSAELRIDRLETFVTGENDRGTLRTATGSGSIAALSYERTAGRVRLSDRDGSIAIGKELAQRAARIGLESTDEAQGLARAEPFLPTRGVYVVEAETGPQVLTSGSGGGRRNPPRNTTIAMAPEGPEETGWRIRLLADGSDFDRNLKLGVRTAATERPVLPDAEPAVAFAEAAPLTEGDADRIINGTKWQRIRSLETAESLLDGIPARVERTFTNTGPERVRFTAQVKTSKFKEGLKVHVTSDALYIERPAVPHDEVAFNQLINDEGTTNQLVDSLVSARGPPDQPTLTGTLRASPAAQEAVNGHADAAAAKLLEEVKTLGLDAALDRFEPEVAPEAIRALEEGKSPELLDAANRTVKADRPNGQILKAIQLYENKEFAGAVENATRAFLGKPSPEVIAATLHYCDQRGAKALGEYFAVKSGLFPEMSAHLRNSVEIRVNGGKIDVVLELKPEVPREPIFLSERDAVIDAFTGQTSPALYYVEDARVLSKLDGTAAPGPTLSDAARNPRLRWTKFTVKGLGGYEPLKLRVGKSVYQRSMIGRSRPTVDAAIGNEPVLYLVRPCTREEDGEDCDESKS